jgi:fumarate reductase subunit D
MSEPNVPPPPSYTPPPPPSGPAPGASSNRTLMIVLSYIGLLCLIPLLVEKEDREVQWHAKHGLVLTAALIIAGIVLGILAQIPFLGCLSALLIPFLMLAGLIIAVLCIMKGVNGERFLIPGISQYADRF